MPGPMVAWQGKVLLVGGQDAGAPDGICHLVHVYGQGRPVPEHLFLGGGGAWGFLGVHGSRFFCFKLRVKNSPGQRFGSISAAKSRSVYFRFMCAEERGISQATGRRPEKALFFQPTAPHRAAKTPRGSTEIQMGQLQPSWAQLSSSPLLKRKTWGFVGVLPQDFG